MLPDYPMMLHGYKVVVDRPRPRMTLAENVPVTPEFRAEINAWMAGFFGYHPGLVERGKALVMEQTRTMVLHPEDYQHMRDGTNGQSFGALGRRRPW